MIEKSILNKDFRHKILKKLKTHNIWKDCGNIERVLSGIIEVSGLNVSIGDVCEIKGTSKNPMLAECVGFKQKLSILTPIGDIHGIHPNDLVLNTNKKASLIISEEMLGKVINSSGQIFRTKKYLSSGEEVEIRSKAPSPENKARINSKMKTNIPIIDGLITLGWGQRIGLFAGPGVGKTTLLSQFVDNSEADVNIVALIGERGREVKEFIDLTESKKDKTILVASTADEPAAMRVMAFLTATAIAEKFRKEGKKVLLVMDSLTRLAQAQREVGLAVGEPPAARGYPPSCNSLIAETLERAGTGEEGEGSISSIYTILVEGGNSAHDPIAETAMAVLDGHISLDRKIAEKGIFPAINIPASISRLQTQICSEEHLKASSFLKKLISKKMDADEAIQLGMYRPGADKELDCAISNWDEIISFLTNKNTVQINAEEEVINLSNKIKMELETHNG